MPSSTCSSLVDLNWTTSPMELTWIHLLCAYTPSVWPPESASALLWWLLLFGMDVMLLMDVRWTNIYDGMGRDTRLDSPVAVGDTPMYSEMYWSKHFDQPGRTPPPSQLPTYPSAICTFKTGPFSNVVPIIIGPPMGEAGGAIQLCPFYGHITVLNFDQISIILKDYIVHMLRLMKGILKAFVDDHFKGLYSHYSPVKRGSLCRAPLKSTYHTTSRMTRPRQHICFVTSLTFLHILKWTGVLSSSRLAV